MNFLEILKLSISTFKTHRLRSFLTTLGIIIGVMTVIAILSLIQGLNMTVEKQISSLGSNTIFVQKVAWGMGRIDFEEISKRKDLTIEDGEALKKLPSVDKLAYTKTTNVGTITYGINKARNIEVIGSDENLQYTSNYSVKSGRFINEDDFKRRRKVCVIGSYVEENLFPNTDPLFKTLNLGGKQFVIVGVLEAKGSFMGQTQDNIIIIPLTTFEEVFPQPAGFQRIWRGLSFQILPKDPKNIEKTIEDIREVLRRRRRLGFDKPDDFGINTQQTLREIYKNITNVAFIVMVAVAAISLIVGGIGIMNIMLVAVAERTREIGLRKAVGASNRDILLQFLVEACTLSFVGGVIGVILGISSAKIIAALTPLEAAAPLWVIILGFLFPIAVGIFFGIYPATRAAKLNPIEALRYE
uniref:FtsX-like permease family protein n=1 Tax=candidate division WOR-3 bacterium TaxID=2052148 RepID=A0A7V4E2Q4_UNCW3